MTEEVMILTVTVILRFIAILCSSTLQSQLPESLFGPLLIDCANI